MRTLAAGLAAVIGLFTAISTQASGNLPDACAAVFDPPPALMVCPTPYVRMEPSSSDAEPGEAWHCCETGYTLQTVSGGGCMGGSGMLRGWSLPEGPCVEATAASIYKDRVLTLFHEFLQMKQDGVFFTLSQIEFFAAGGVELPNRTRGAHPPGGFFARPPGSEWLEKVNWLKQEGTELSDTCFDIPKDLNEDGFICGGELTMFVSAATDLAHPSHLADLERQFWLAKICYEAPAACGLVE